MPSRHVISLLIGLLLLGVSTPVIADEVLRDPTRPYSARAVRTLNAPVFTVNAIFSSAERRVAIVNGQRVGVGGRVDGATVVSIDKNQLVLTIGNKSITAKLTYGAPQQ